MNRWIEETRPRFLALAVLLVAHGAALAAARGHAVDLPRAALAALMLALLHAAVNVLNDWHDFARSGIDRVVRRTPFSGGSGLLPAGRMSPREALALGVVTLAAGTLAGLHLALGAPAREGLLAIGGAGLLSVLLYTPFFTRVGLGECVAGFSLGTLPVAGTYLLFAGRLDAAAWAAGLPAGLLTFNLLLLNEFPDRDADMAGGRRHLVARLGTRRASRLYVAVEAAAFLALAAFALLRVLPAGALAGLLALPFAWRAARGALSAHDGFEALFPAMAANVGAVLGMNALAAAGLLAGAAGRIW